MSSLTIVITFILTFILISGTSAQFISIHTGRKLPISFIEKHFPSTPVDLAKKRLYEITPDNRLVGELHNVSLRTSAGVSRRIMYTMPSSEFLNGVALPPQKQTDLFFREETESGFIVAHDSDDTVFNVWSAGFSLLPLDAMNHPGIFVQAVRDGIKYRTIDADHISANSTRLDGLNETSMNVLFHHVDRRNYRREDSKHRPKKSATVNGNALSSTRQFGSPCRAGSRSREVDLAVAFSSVLCQNFGSYGATRNAVISAVALANAPYIANTCITLRVSTIDGYCGFRSNDPYASYRSQFSGSEAGKLRMLDAFSLFWYRNRDNVRRDLALFLSGWEDGNNLAGAATLASMCSKTVGYAWVEMLFPVVIAHEIGHSLSAQHDNSGLMRATVDVSQPSFSFSQRSANVINGYAPSSTCLTRPATTGPRSCGVLFARRPDGASCAKRKFPNVRFRLGATVATSIEVRSGKVTVRMNLSSRVQSRFRYRKFAVLVTTDGSISTLEEIGQIAGIATVNGNRFQVQKIFFVNSLKSKTGWATCCNRPLFIYTYVEVESADGTSRLFGSITKRYTWNLKCRTCSGGAAIQRMNAKKQCPTCGR